MIRKTSLAIAFTLLAFLMASGALMAVPSYTGPTGGLTIPDPMTLAPDRTELSVSLESLDQLTTDLSVKTSLDFTGRLTVGVYDNLELGIAKTYRQKSSFRDQPFTIHGKMRFPMDTFNVAVGLIAPVSGPDASSMYVVGGWKSLWAGFGINFGGKSFRELTTTQLINAGVSRFGGFSLQRVTKPGRTGEIFTGEADTFFGLVGFNYQLSGNMALLGDFDGDRFAGGFRFRLKELFLDAAYVGQKENDSLFSRQTNNVLLSVSHRF